MASVSFEIVWNDDLIFVFTAVIIGWKFWSFKFIVIDRIELDGKFDIRSFVIAFDQWVSCWDGKLFAVEYFW
mgnify:CR=1 FL=1